MSKVYKLSETDEEVLKQFSKKVERLRTSVEKHMSKKITVRWEVGKETQAEGLTDEIIEAGLVSIVRQLVFKGESLEFNKVVNILLRKYSNDPVKVDRLRRYKKVCKKLLDNPNPLFGIGPTDNPFTQREVFEMVAYSDHIHTNITDRKRYEKYKSLTEGWLAPIVRIQLEAIVLSVAQLTINLKRQFIDI